MQIRKDRQTSVLATTDKPPYQPLVGLPVLYNWDGIVPNTGAQGWPPPHPGNVPSINPTAAIITSVVSEETGEASLFCMGTGDQFVVKGAKYGPDTLGCWQFIQTPGPTLTITPETA